MKENKEHKILKKTSYDEQISKLKKSKTLETIAFGAMNICTIISFNNYALYQQPEFIVSGLTFSTLAGMNLLNLIKTITQEEHLKNESGDISETQSYSNPDETPKSLGVKKC